MGDAPEAGPTHSRHSVHGRKVTKGCKIHVSVAMGAQRLKSSLYMQDRGRHHVNKDTEGRKCRACWRDSPGESTKM